MSEQIDNSFQDHVGGSGQVQEYLPHALEMNRGNQTWNQQEIEMQPGLQTQADTQNLEPEYIPLEYLSRYHGQDFQAAPVSVREEPINTAQESIEFRPKTFYDLSVAQNVIQSEPLYVALNQTGAVQPQAMDHSGYMSLTHPQFSSSLQVQGLTLPLQQEAVAAQVPIPQQELFLISQQVTLIATPTVVYLPTGFSTISLVGHVINMQQGVLIAREAEVTQPQPMLQSPAQLSPIPYRVVQRETDRRVVKMHDSRQVVAGPSQGVEVAPQEARHYSRPPKSRRRSSYSRIVSAPSSYNDRQSSVTGRSMRTHCSSNVREPRQGYQHWRRNFGNLDGATSTQQQSSGHAFATPSSSSATSKTFCDRSTSPMPWSPFNAIEEAEERDPAEGRDESIFKSDEQQDGPSSLRVIVHNNERIVLHSSGRKPH